jgi:hypothetical protein
LAEPDIAGSAFFTTRKQGKGETGNMSENGKNKGRMTIYAMAGIYLLFMAKNLFDNLPYSSGNEKIIMTVFMVFFILIGGGMIIFGLYKWYRMSMPSGDEEEIHEIEEEKEDNE